MLRNQLTGLALFAILILSAGPTSAETINFESVPGLTAMANQPGALVPSSARLANQYLSSIGVGFSSSADYVALVDLGGGTTSPTRGIGGVTALGELSYADPVRISFFVPGTLTTPGVTDFVSIRGDIIPVSQSATLRAFDVGGALLHTLTLPDSNGQTWTIAMSGIHAIEFSGVSGQPFGQFIGIALDDLSFNAVTAVPTPMALAAGIVLLPAAFWQSLRRVKGTH